MADRMRYRLDSADGGMTGLEQFGTFLSADKAMEKLRRTLRENDCDEGTIAQLMNGVRAVPVVKPKRVPRLERVAFHEAGHVVAMLLLKVPFTHVTIVPNEDEGSLGHVLRKPFKKGQVEEIEFGDPRRARDIVEREIIHSMAGHVCERLRSGRHGFVGSRGDMKTQVDLALHVTGSAEEASAFVRWLWCRTELMMQQPRHWEAVTKVAQALLETPTLRAHRVRKIVAPVLHP